MIPDTTIPRDRGVISNFAENLQQPRHRWYPFKEGFSNQLVRAAIAEARVKKRRLQVLDPFGGSGTSAVTSALLGHNAVSIEVNPFCAFTARVKCTPGSWRQRGYLEAVDRACHSANLCRKTSWLEAHSTFCEGNGNEKWLFGRDVLRAFGAAISTIERSTNGYAPALRLAALKAAMMCCNAKKDGKALRYHTNWIARGYTRDHFIEGFRAAAHQMLADVSLAPISRDREVLILQADARKALDRFAAQSFDLLITSPPYLNSFDYSDVYRPELFLGGWIENNQDLRELRLKTLRSHIQVNWPRKQGIKNARITSIVNRLRNCTKLWDQRIPLMVEAYFDDMLNVLRQVARLLRDGAPAWIVVSSSAYAGIHVPVDSILADLACGCGFELDGISILRQLRASGQQWAKFGTSEPPLRESLIMLRRTSFRSNVRKCPVLSGF
jgi:DNA modification methylase